MDFSLPDMLRLLEDEESVLKQMRAKIFDELQRLQVEEEMFMRTLRNLSQKQGKVNDQCEAVDGDHELIESLKEALKEGTDKAA